MEIKSLKIKEAEELFCPHISSISNCKADRCVYWNKTITNHPTNVIYPNSIFKSPDGGHIGKKFKDGKLFNMEIAFTGDLIKEEEILFPETPFVEMLEKFYNKKFFIKNDLVYEELTRDYTEGYCLLVANKQQSINSQS